MTIKTKRILCGTLAAVAVVVAVVGLDSVYLLGYRNGSRDALDWDFSAVAEGRVVKVGRGSSLLRSRLDLRPVRSVNIFSATLSSPKAQP
jgi:hypothetical protein